VPGITTAVAAPLLAGIPVTHRGVASAFVVVSGHAASAFEPVLASLEPGSATIVVLMGLANRAEIARALVAAGWVPFHTGGHRLRRLTSDEHVWRGTLDGLRRGDRDITRHAAGNMVIGEVVNVLAITASPHQQVTNSSEALCLS
jgi:uroporphyrin-III C-methyltransferase/precorrin-2 dehydrogenase/sirohydrochlorin ferrochelatase